MVGVVLGCIAVVFAVVCFLLVFIILLQDSKGEGLSSSAFGGDGLQSVLGGHGAATFLSKATVYLAVAFLVMSLVLMRWWDEPTDGRLSLIEGNPEESPVQAVSPGIEAGDTIDQLDRALDQKTSPSETNQMDATEDSKANATEDNREN